ncbi:MFS transporter [Dendrosporobacter sp. 1207_IL3150]|uniref:MFS transporter n=1 Tax=Dendrosporobacter sp. 1207_IL3150 TaxID=3084054 RepID=UPI002FD909DA
MGKISAGTKKIHTKALLTGGLAHLIHDGFTDMLYVFFPIWQSQFLLTFTEIGFLKTLFSGTMACFQVPSSYLAYRIGEIRLLLLGTVLTSIAVYLYGWAPSPVVLGFLLIAGGLGSSVQHPLSSSLISNAYTDNISRRVALSTFNVAGDIGKLLLPAGASLIISQYSWQAASQVIGLVGIVAAIILYKSSKNIIFQNEQQKSVKRAISLVSWKASKGFWALLMIGMIDSSTRMGFLTFFPFVLQEKGAGVTTIGLALSLIFAGGAMGKFICGMLAAKVGIIWSVIITEILTALCIVGMLSFSLHTDIILSLFLGVALNGTSSVLYGSVPELVSEENRKQAFAVFYTATIASGAVSPWVYGAVSDIVGINTSVILVALVVLLAIPLTIPIKGKLIG